jgi:hypothetical protein
LQVGSPLQRRDGEAQCRARGRFAGGANAQQWQEPKQSGNRVQVAALFFAVDPTAPGDDQRPKRRPRNETRDKPKHQEQGHGATYAQRLCRLAHHDVERWL